MGLRQLLVYVLVSLIVRTPVHISFCWKGVFELSGEATSGRKGVKGLMRSRNRTIGSLALKQEPLGFYNERHTAAHVCGGVGSRRGAG